MLYADFAFPIIYAALFWRLGALATGAAAMKGVFAWLATACPVAAAISDYAENIALLYVLRALPRRIDSAVRIASFFTSAKFLFSWATIALLLIAAGIALLK